jgi:hypothetical protein
MDITTGGHFIIFEVADTTEEAWCGKTKGRSTAEGLEMCH